MKTLTVTLEKQSYPIYIGAGLLSQTELLAQHIKNKEVCIVTNTTLSQTELLAQHIKNKEVCIVTNTTVSQLYLKNLTASLSDNFNCEVVVLPDGEQYKTLIELNQIFDQLLRSQFSRQVTLIALGGGVIGDMAGFAAACYQRGVRFIQIPTTLLSQVDSSVGGKTAVNHALGKNMIGAFYQPECVIADTATLNTLDERQLSSGLAEVIKYGLINDLIFFEWLERNIAGLRYRDESLLAEAIERSCNNKANIVAKDEREKGVRALLNLGHTFGHAIETGMGYGQVLHGEAIAIGMMMAANLSLRLGWLMESDVARIEQLFIAAGLPVKVPSKMSETDFMSLMAIDKKVQDGVIRLVLLKEIGHAVISDSYGASLLSETLIHYTGESGMEE